MISEKIKEFTATTEESEYKRMIELFKIGKLLAESKNLNLAKFKLKDIFPIELLPEISNFMYLLLLS